MDRLSATRGENLLFQSIKNSESSTFEFREGNTWFFKYLPEFANDDYPDKDFMWVYLGIKKECIQKLVPDSSMARSKNEEVPKIL